MCSSTLATRLLFFRLALKLTLPITAAFCIATLHPARAEALSYSVLEIGDLPAVASITGRGLDDTGTATTDVFIRPFPVPGSFRGVRFSPSGDATFLPLAHFAGTDIWDSFYENRAFGASPNGQFVVGQELVEARVSIPSRGIVWRAGTPSVLPSIGKCYVVRGQAVNDEGLIVGDLQGDGPDCEGSVLLRGDLAEILPGNRTEGVSISKNFIAGHTLISPSSDYDQGLIRAFLYNIHSRQMTIFPQVITRGGASFAKAVNNRGIAVGIIGRGYYDNDPGSDMLMRAVRWQRGQMQRLPELPGTTESFASAINNRGAIVGSIKRRDAGAAVLWKEDQVIDLNTAVPAGTPRLIEASAINNRGQILASTSYGLAILTPVP